MKILLAITAAACMAAVPAAAQYQTPQGNQNQPYQQNNGYHQNDRRYDHDRDNGQYNNGQYNNGYNQNGYYQNQDQSANPRVRREENAQERASNINDSVNIVNGPRLENVTPRSAWLTWTTNDVAATRVVYGTNPNNPQQHAYIEGGTRDHHVQLNNLEPGRTYYYEIETRHGKDRFKGTFQTPRG